MIRSRGLDDSNDRAQVSAEGGERLRDRLFVPDVGVDVEEDRQAGARLGGHVQTGLVHQAEQTQRSQRDRLSARVRASDQQRGVAVSEADVDRHHPAR